MEFENSPLHRTVVHSVIWVKICVSGNKSEYRTLTRTLKWSDSSMHRFSEGIIVVDFNKK